MNGRSQLERRLIALSLLAGVVALLLFGLILPLAHGFTARAEAREQAAEDLIRGRRLVAQRDIWVARLQRQRADAGQYAIVAANASAAAQQTTERISAAVQAPGGALLALREQPPGPGEARLRVEARLTLTQLVASLKLIEGLKPFVVIENLAVAADPTAAAGQVPPMDVRIDLAVPYQVTSG